jgi:hypothetical protein
MIKKILISLVLFLLIIGGGVFYYFDSIVKSGIEVVGTRVLGTQVSVGSTLVSPLSGSGSISGLQVRNPEGFDAEYVFQMDQIEVNLNASTVMSDVVEIESVIISRPQITYERRLTTDNIRALLENIGSAGGSGEASSEESASTRRIIIREFRMLQPQLNLVAASIEAPLPLPDIVLNNIGEESNAATVAEAARQILRAINTSILNSDLPVLDMLRENVENRLQDGVQEVENAVEEVGNRLRGLFDNN